MSTKKMVIPKRPGGFGYSLKRLRGILLPWTILPIPGRESDWRISFLIILFLGVSKPTGSFDIPEL